MTFTNLPCLEMNFSRCVWTQMTWKIKHFQHLKAFLFNSFSMQKHNLKENIWPSPYFKHYEHMAHTAAASAATHTFPTMSHIKLTPGGQAASSWMGPASVSWRHHLAYWCRKLCWGQCPRYLQAGGGEAASAPLGPGWKTGRETVN